MKYIPILFSTPMVQSILANRKTKTRRTMKVQPVLKENGFWEVYGAGWSNSERMKIPCVSGHSLSNNCPYGQVGDILWVRESWSSLNTDTGIEYAYKAGVSGATLEAMKDYKLKWKPSIHMPKTVCRLFLKITNIRVERLQDISEEDAVAEGVEKYYYDTSFYKKYGSENDWCATAYASFAYLWEQINGVDSWNANPWVWVLEFERIEKPENFI